VSTGINRELEKNLGIKFYIKYSLYWEEELENFDYKLNLLECLSPAQYNSTNKYNFLNPHSQILKSQITSARLSI